jgi:hypothetical protein
LLSHPGSTTIGSMDQVVVFGVPLFVLSVRSFVPALALAVLAYELAAARAERRGDARWLLVSLAGAVLAAFVVEVEPSDGARGIVGPIFEATLGAASVGLVELVRWSAATLALHASQRRLGLGLVAHRGLVRAGQGR